jgi:hypothetical protein
LLEKEKEEEKEGKLRLLEKRKGGRKEKGGWRGLKGDL